jgi:hypothetical protein
VEFCGEVVQLALQLRSRRGSLRGARPAESTQRNFDAMAHDALRARAPMTFHIHIGFRRSG